jgi:hypothetical protein
MAELAFAPIPSGQIPGVVITVVLAFLSAFALIFVAFRWLWLSLRPSFSTNDPETASRESLFFHTQLGVYSVCLLASNMFSSLAGLLEISWAAGRGIQEGSVCTAQAVMMQIGNVSTAFFTATIAIHSFNSLVLHNRNTIWFGVLVVVAGWISAVVIATAPLLAHQPLGPLYGVSALSCGVKRVYAKQQFLFHLLPILLASIISVALYSLIFLVLRGTLTIKGGLRVNLNPYIRRSGRIGNNEEYHRFMNTIAKSMLWYPFAYILLLLPYSITRLVDLSGFKVSPGGNVFALSCWSLQGLVNVLLLYNTFRVIGLAFDAVSTSSGSRKGDMESFGSSEKSYAPSVAKTNPQAIQVPARSHSTTQPSRTRALTLQQSPSISSNGRRYHHHGGSDGTTVSAASLQRAITPISELNHELLAAPEVALRKGATSTPRLRLQTDDGESIASTGSTGLPPPPRHTRSPIMRKPTLESLPPSSPQTRQGKKPSHFNLSPTVPMMPNAHRATGNFSIIDMYGNAEVENVRNSFGTTPGMLHEIAVNSPSPTRYQPPHSIAGSSSWQYGLAR